MNAALVLLKEKIPHPPLTFCWFVQEEIGIQGAQNVRLGMLGKPAMAFNWDGGVPTMLESLKGAVTQLEQRKKGKTGECHVERHDVVIRDVAPTQGNDQRTNAG